MRHFLKSSLLSLSALSILVSPALASEAGGSAPVYPLEPGVGAISLHHEGYGLFSWSASGTVGAGGVKFIFTEITEDGGSPLYSSYHESANGQDWANPHAWDDREATPVAVVVCEYLGTDEELFEPIYGVCSDTLIVSADRTEVSIVPIGDPEGSF